MFKRELKEIVFSWQFVVAVLCVTFCMNFENWKDIPGYGDVGILYLLDEPLCIGAGALFFSVFSAFPFTARYFAEQKGGYWRHVWIRTTKGKYIGKKIFLAAISGILVILIGIALYLMICVFRQKGGIEIGTGMGEQINEYWSRLFQKGREEQVFVEKLGAVVAYGAMWPVLALAFSTIIKSQYVAMILPYVVEMALDFGAEWAYANFRGRFFWLGLSQVLLIGNIPFEVKFSPVWYSAGYILLWLIIFGGIYAIGFRRKNS